MSYYGLWEKKFKYWHRTPNGAITWYPSRVIAEEHQMLLDGGFSDPKYYQWEVREFKSAADKERENAYRDLPAGGYQ